MLLVNHAFARVTPAIFVVLTGSDEQSPCLLGKIQICHFRSFHQKPSVWHRTQAQLNKGTGFATPKQQNQIIPNHPTLTYGTQQQLPPPPKEKKKQHHPSSNKDAATCKNGCYISLTLAKQQALRTSTRNTMTICQNMPFFWDDRKMANPLPPQKRREQQLAMIQCEVGPKMKSLVASQPV